MDILIEFILDLLFEGLFEGASNKRVPKPLRIIFIVILVLIYAAIIGAFVIIGVSIINKGNTGGGVVIIVCGLVLAALIVWGVFRERRKRLEKKQREQYDKWQGRSF